MPRLLHSLADGAHGLTDAPLGLPGLAAPPGLEDLQVRPQRSGMGQTSHGDLGLWLEAERRMREPDFSPSLSLLTRDPEDVSHVLG